MVDFVVRLARDADVPELVERLLEHDRVELEALSAMPLQDLVQLSLETSLEAHAATVDGEVAALWGLSGSVCGDVGSPWLLAAEPVLRAPMSFLRRCKPRVRAMLEVFPLLENDVWAGNVRAVRWLRWLGFELEAPRPYGYLGLPFHHFTMGARDV